MGEIPVYLRDMDCMDCMSRSDRVNSAALIPCSSNVRKSGAQPAKILSTAPTFQLKLVALVKVIRFNNGAAVVNNPNAAELLLIVSNDELSSSSSI